jgi:hypothetical protein
MHNSPIRVAVVDDHEVIRAGVEAMLRPYADRIRVVATPGDANRGGRSVRLAGGGSDRYPDGVDAMSSLTRGSARRHLHVVVHPGPDGGGIEKGVSGYVSKRLPADRLVVPSNK